MHAHFRRGRSKSFRKGCGHISEICLGRSLHQEIHEIFLSYIFWDQQQDALAARFKELLNLVVCTSLSFLEVLGVTSPVHLFLAMAGMVMKNNWFLESYTTV